MREYMGLYRGKRIDNGEWVQGSLLKVTVNGRTYWLIFGDDFAQIGADIKAMQHACVNPDTIGECTGLTDKNGKLIFEGDILRFGLRCDYECYLESLERPEDYDSEVYDQDIEVTAVDWCIDYDYPAFDLRCHSFDCNGLAQLMCGDYEHEIIGNIHDNPELLKGSGANE